MTVTKLHKISLPPGSPVIVCFGAGVDSTAMLIELRKAGITPDLITFADTSAEKPETYRHLDRMDPILESWGFPKTTRVKYLPKEKTAERYIEAGGDAGLVGNCFANETLPSLAFGMKSCSNKWKIQAQDYYIKGCKSGPNACEPHPVWTNAIAQGVKPVKLIGYDNGPADLRRSKNLKSEDQDFHYRYPLQQLEMERAQCVATIAADLGPDMVPVKSACFMCPASKKWELWWLAGAHPEMLEKALALEINAMTGHHTRFDEIEMGAGFMELIGSGDRWPSSKTTVGLGRSFAWNHWARVNNVVDESGKVVADPDYCLAMADKERGTGTDNAEDFRNCGGCEARQLELRLVA